MLFVYFLICLCSLRLCPACQHSASTKPPNFFVLCECGVDVTCEIIVLLKGEHKNSNDVTT